MSVMDSKHGLQAGVHENRCSQVIDYCDAGPICIALSTLLPYMVCGDPEAGTDHSPGPGGQ